MAKGAKMSNGEIRIYIQEEGYVKIHTPEGTFTVAVGPNDQFWGTWGSELSYADPIDGIAAKWAYGDSSEYTTFFWGHGQEFHYTRFIDNPV